MAASTTSNPPDPTTYEAQHVHSVYDSIASHFSSTRYKPWPIVASFLTSLPPGSIGLDAGAGNGKYLAVNPHIVILASDRSPPLLRHGLQHTRTSAHDLLVADVLALPHPQARFDFAMSIAALHHLSTSERRIAGVRALLRPLRTGGRCLIFVWALEQKASRRGWDKGMEQDVMVPWVRGQETFERYYHLYSEGELERDVAKAGGVVIEGGYEKDNWWVVAGSQV